MHCSSYYPSSPWPTNAVSRTGSDKCTAGGKLGVWCTDGLAARHRTKKTMRSARTPHSLAGDLRTPKTTFRRSVFLQGCCVAFPLHFRTDRFESAAPAQQKRRTEDSSLIRGCLTIVRLTRLPSLATRSMHWLLATLLCFFAVFTPVSTASSTRSGDFAVGGLPTMSSFADSNHFSCKRQPPMQMQGGSESMPPFVQICRVRGGSLQRTLKCQTAACHPAGFGDLFLGLKSKVFSAF